MLFKSCRAVIQSRALRNEEMALPKLTLAVESLGSRICGRSSKCANFQRYVEMGQNPGTVVNIKTSGK
jgi:hypothetical protein